MGMKSVLSSMEDSLYLPWMPLWVFVFCVMTIWVLRRYTSSTFGKGVSAICRDEVAAEIMSVNTNRIKMLTFMLSSGLAGLAGGLFAYILGYVNPGSFGILKSTEVLVMVYLGGMGSLSGAVLSAVSLPSWLELLRPLADHQMDRDSFDPDSTDAVPAGRIDGESGLSDLFHD